MEIFLHFPGMKGEDPGVKPRRQRCMRALQREKDTFVAFRKIEHESMFLLVSLLSCGLRGEHVEMWDTKGTLC